MGIRLFDGVNECLEIPIYNFMYRIIYIEIVSIYWCIIKLELQEAYEIHSLDVDNK